LPTLPTSHIPDFMPGVRLTLERWLAIKSKLQKEKFLWPQEIELIGWILRQDELGLAWDDSHKGQFRSDYFEDIKFPVVEHIPWSDRNMRIAPSMHDKLIIELKRKIATGVLEPS
ncbi:hypothetical protein SISSUDRAFT_972919, partial [Sistotremastrum suecicum HHB10207 ss-3]